MAASRPGLCPLVAPGILQPPPGRGLHPTHSTPCPEVTSITATHSPSGRASCMALGAQEPGSAGPWQCLQPQLGTMKGSASSQWSASRLGQWAALTWLVMRPAPSTILDRVIEPSDFPPQGRGPPGLSSICLSPSLGMKSQELHGRHRPHRQVLTTRCQESGLEAQPRGGSQHHYQTRSQNKRLTCRECRMVMAEDTGRRKWQGSRGGRERRWGQFCPG